VAGGAGGCAFFCTGLALGAGWRRGAAAHHRFWASACVWMVLYGRYLEL